MAVGEPNSSKISMSRSTPNSSSISDSNVTPASESELINSATSTVRISASVRLGKTDRKQRTNRSYDSATNYLPTSKAQSPILFSEWDRKQLKPSANLRIDNSMKQRWHPNVKSSFFKPTAWDRRFSQQLEEHISNRLITRSRFEVKHDFIDLQFFI